MKEQGHYLNKVLSEYDQLANILNLPSDNSIPINVLTVLNSMNTNMLGNENWSDTERSSTGKIMQAFVCLTYPELVANDPEFPLDAYVPNNKVKLDEVEKEVLNTLLHNAGFEETTDEVQIFIKPDPS